MDKLKNKKTLIIIIISIFVIALIGGVYAYYQKVIANISANTITQGLDYYINYAKGTDITNGVLNPSTDYTGGNSVTVTFNKKDNTYDIYGHIYLDISTIGNKLKNSEALKYTVVDSNNMILKNGVLIGISSNSSKQLIANIPLSTTPETYTIYLWLDENALDDYTIEGESISANVRCDATMKKIETGVMINLFNPTETITNNCSNSEEIDENYKIIKDIYGDMHYYGANPNNYVKFNCESYPDTNCEMWRIIGMFDGKIKLMRNESVGKYSYDIDTSVSDGLGYSEWSQADLMKLLNPGYESNEDLNKTKETILINNSLYYNSRNGTCYNGRYISTINCDFTSTGIKNEVTRNMIYSATHYIGVGVRSNTYSCSILKNEKEGNNWDGKIALPTASDYGYSADPKLCTNTLDLYENCNDNNWMSDILTSDSSSGWIMTKRYEKEKWYIGSTGAVVAGSDTYPRAGRNVVPVLYLSTDVEIDTGHTGSIRDPYLINE